MTTVLVWLLSITRRTKCSQCGFLLPRFKIPYGDDRYAALFCSFLCQRTWELERGSHDLV